MTKPGGIYVEKICGTDTHNWLINYRESKQTLASVMVIYSLICDSFNKAVSSSDYTALNEVVNE